MALLIVFVVGAIGDVLGAATSWLDRSSSEENKSLFSRKAGRAETPTHPPPTRCGQLLTRYQIMAPDEVTEIWWKQQKLIFSSLVFFFQYGYICSSTVFKKY